MSSSSSANVKLGSSSSSNLRKSKRTVYFENYARSLVVEAFKRCITVRVQQHWAAFAFFSNH